MRNAKGILLFAATSAALTAQPGPGPHGPHGRMMGTLPNEMTSEANPLTPAKIDLGRMLFYDPRLSKDGTVSCNSCHALDNYGADGTPVSTGHQGLKGTRNSPTVYNAAGHILQFWDGRAASVEEQAKGPVLNPVEMAMPSPEAAEARLRAIPGYVRLFQQAFPDSPEPVTFDNMAKAIGAFERRLVTPSRWDRFLSGDRRAITDQEFSGHHEFMHAGCAQCHNGPYVGGGSLQKAGKVKPWPVSADLGRMGVTKAETDRMVFKVPSLRNAAKTAPYFHDGSAADLSEAIRMMGIHQLGITLDPAQVRAIRTWLGSLTGDIPKDYVRPPQLP
ncbi:MAG: cytochrome-c peroxidase [Acidobacteria bacterium]|nr:cytochrome-c peroxidase [Acidobacteriota bacterium]